MKSDEQVKLPTLKRRLSAVRLAQEVGTLQVPLRFKRCKQPEYTASGLLVSESWLKDSLEKRALELEYLIVSRIGIEGLKFKVKRKSEVTDIFEVEALNPDEALKKSKNGTKPKWTKSKVLGYEIEEID